MRYHRTHRQRRPLTLIFTIAGLLCVALTDHCIAQFPEYRDALISPPDVRISAYPGNDARHAGVPGDVNGDGYDDLLVGQLPSPIKDPWGIGLYLGSASPPPHMSADGSTGFGPVVQLDRGQATASPYYASNHNHFGDLNGDGRDDILLTTGAGYLDFAIVFGRSTWPASMIRAQHGEADVYIAAPSNHVYVPSSNIGPADYNGDGIDDLVISRNVTFYDANQPDSGHMYIFYGSSEWPDFIYPGLTSGYLTYSGSPQQYMPIVVSSADINRDGYDEMIGLSRLTASEQTQNYLTVIQGAPELPANFHFGGESVPGMYNEPLDGDGIIFDDFTGDGLTDLAVQRTTEILLFFDIARWTPALNYSTNPNVRIVPENEQPDHTFSIHAGDVNGDSIADLLFVDYYTRFGMSESIEDKSIHIFYGRPNWPATINLVNQFADVTLIGIDPLVYGTDLRPNGVPSSVLGDLNADGAEDIFLNHHHAMSIVLGGRDLPGIIRIQYGEADFTIGNITVPEIGPVFFDFNGDSIKDFFFQSGVYNQHHDVHILFGRPAPTHVYVKTTTSLPGDGTTAKPYRSIRLGLKTVKTSGTVHIDAGSGPIVIDTPQRLSKPLTIRRQ